MRLRTLDWSRQVLLAMVTVATFSLTACGQDAPAAPPAPVADTGESVPEAIANNSTSQAYQSYQACPSNGGACQSCQPASCGQRFRNCWARCKAKEQAKWWGYPEEFQELPFGCQTYALMDQPVARGHQARMSLYYYDFASGTEQLNSAGRRRVARLAPMLQAGWGPLVLEESPNAELDQKRRSAVFQELALVYPGATMDSVVVGFPIGAGLNGVEGRAINRSLMNQTGARGVGSVSSRGGFTPGVPQSNSGNSGGGGGGVGGSAGR